MRASKKDSRLSVMPLARRQVRGAVLLEPSVAIRINPGELALRREEALKGQPGSGLQLLASMREDPVRVDTSDPESAVWVSYLAQWSACVPNGVEVVRRLVAGFSAEHRSALPITAYGHLRLAEGIVALEGGNWELAASHLDLAVTLAAQQSGESGLGRLAQFWRSVLYRRQGRLDLALERVHALCSHSRADERGPLLVMAGLLNIDRDKPGRGLELLREAEALLLGPEDWFWRSALRRGLARVALREGRYEQAHEWLAESAALLQAQCPQHPKLASLLVALASAQRLSALRLARTVDLHAAEQRRKRAACREEANQETRRRMEELRGAALENLRLAGAPKAGGSPYQAALESCRLLMDCGQLDVAAGEAAAAFRVGAAEGDTRVMIHARLLQGRIEFARYEDGIGASPDRRAQMAHDLAQEAAGMAARAGDQRLLAEAHTLLGTILAAEPISNPEAAREHCERAGELIGTTCRDWLWDDYQALAEKVLLFGAVDSKLRRWSQGLVDNRTFQQMTEEFADLVIPSVWEREGRNVSRVVAKLSISPKKVRRILQRMSLKAVPE